MAERYAYTYDIFGRPLTVTHGLSLPCAVQSGEYSYVVSKALHDVRYDFAGRLVVDDPDRSVLQVNHYDPYGELLPCSSSAQPSPYKFIGKEWDSRSGSYAFGARQYIPVSTTTVPRWTTMDPLAEKYYSLSPYAYCAGDPVNLVDPEGKDIFRFDKYGHFVKREENKEYDEVRFETEVRDESGEKIDNTIQFAYGTIRHSGSYHPKDLNGNTKAIDLFQIRGKDNARKLFAFFDKNTDFEWVLFQTEKFLSPLDGGEMRRGTNHHQYLISTSYSIKEENSVHPIFKALVKKGYSVSEITHNHKQSGEPSGADKDFAKKYPSIVYYIYYGGTYYYYE